MKSVQQYASLLKGFWFFFSSACSSDEASARHSDATIYTRKSANGAYDGLRGDDECHP